MCYQCLLFFLFHGEEICGHTLKALLTFYRICSVASLNPYFGSLLPVLKEMVRDNIQWCSFAWLIQITDNGLLQVLACNSYPLPRISDDFHNAC